MTAATKCFEAHDSIRIAGGVFILSAGTDGFHVESKKDNGKEYICIFGGDITVNAMDDAFHATSVIQIDGGSMNITAAEGLEGEGNAQVSEGDRDSVPDSLAERSLHSFDDLPYCFLFICLK